MCVDVCSWDKVFWLQFCIIVLAGDSDKAEGLSKPFREGPLRRGHCKQWSDPEHLYMCNNRIRVSMCSVRSVITIAIVVGATIAYFNMVWPFLKRVSKIVFSLDLAIVVHVCRCVQLGQCVLAAVLHYSFGRGQRQGGGVAQAVPGGAASAGPLQAMVGPGTLIYV